MCCLLSHNSSLLCYTRWQQWIHPADEALSQKMSTQIHCKLPLVEYRRFSVTISIETPIANRFTVYSTAKCTAEFAYITNRKICYIHFDRNRWLDFQSIHLNVIWICQKRLPLSQINPIKWHSAEFASNPFGDIS